MTLMISDCPVPAKHHLPMMCLFWSSHTLSGFPPVKVSHRDLDAISCYRFQMKGLEAGNRERWEESSGTGCFSYTATEMTHKNTVRKLCPDSDYQRLAFPPKRMITTVFHILLLKTKTFRLLFSTNPTNWEKPMGAFCLQRFPDGLGAALLRRHSGPGLQVGSHWFITWVLRWNII